MLRIVILLIHLNFKQNLYVAYLWMYLNYHPTNNFPINLETVYARIGFANKNNAKRTLKNNFTIDEDYKILLIPKDEKKNILTKDLGGRPEETILLNTDTFKKFMYDSKNTAIEYYNQIINLL